MTSAGNDKTIKRLDKEAEKERVLPQLLEFYQKLLRIQSGIEQRIDLPKPSLSNEAITNRIEHGLPLIRFDELPLDWPLLHETSAEVAATFAAYPELFSSAPDNLRELGVSYPLTQETVKAWFEGSRLLSSNLINNASESLLESIIQATLKPFLASYSKALLSSVNQENWRRGFCPICGGNPDFAFLDKERGARWLMCSRCDAEWLFQRLECPYCDNKDQSTLAYFTDDEGLYRLYVCEQCHTYIKAIDLRHTESEVLLPLERIMTLDMDRQGLEKGYQPYHPKIRT